MDLREKTENLNRHPWELSRCYNILKLLKKNEQNLVYADIGSGDRFFASKLLQVTNGKVFAIDKGYNKNIAEEDGLVCLNDISLLENNSIDCLIMMDVLEHIESEDAFSVEVLDKLKPNGNIIITVPAMQFLYSSHDAFLKHYRRYSRKQLINILQKKNITIEQCHYFYGTLFVLRCISLLFEVLRLNRKKENLGVGLWGYASNSFITRFLVLILNIEFFLNKHMSKIHIYLPGLSLLAVCRKN